MSDTYPKSSVVRPGATLGHLVNSIMTAESADFASFRHWKGQDYLVDNGQGVYGAITFKGRSVVGTFFDAKSERTPYQFPDTYDLNRFFRGMPPDHRSILAEGPLQYFHERLDGTDIPCITAAFWDGGEYLTAADPWDVVLAEGGRLVRIEMMKDTNEALAEWQEDYQMTREQVAFARSLFNRKMAHPEPTIELTQAEVEWLRSTSKDPNEKGIAVCRDKLAAVGILMP
jgi:hypothetical protein